MISIIMPVLNEATIVSTTLETLLQQSGNYEVVLVDGGSTDGTCDLAKPFPVRIVQMSRDQPAGIGNQINLGAQVATGDIFLFLHADVQLPNNAISLIETALADPNMVGGGFVPVFRNIAPNMVTHAGRVMLKIVEHVWQLRTRLFRWFAGDTAPFVRADVFRRCGGYSVARFASDWDFAEQLRRLGRLAVIREPVGVNSRRHIYNGVLKTLLVTGSIELMYRFGVGRDFLRDWYRKWLPNERLQHDNAYKHDHQNKRMRDRKNKDRLHE